jgi:hypothetical protein
MEAFECVKAKISDYTDFSSGVKKVGKPLCGLPGVST